MSKGFRKSINAMENSKLPYTPSKVFSNNLNAYNKVLRDESPSPFDSRKCVMTTDDMRQLRVHNLRRASCELASDNSYQSKVFYIRYSDELVRLNELICFKSELETDFVAEGHQHEQAG